MSSTVKKDLQCSSETAEFLLTHTCSDWASTPVCTFLAAMPATRRSSRNKSVASGIPGASASAAKPAHQRNPLPQSPTQQTTDEWYKSSRTKKGYANYVKSGKSGCVRGCQGDFWKYNAHTKKWEGNPVFESGFKSYYESLKNRQNRTGTATQALPMLPVDLKLILEYLDSEEAIKYFTLTQRLYFKAFVTTAFTLWTRNDELINLQFKDIKMNLRSPTGIPDHEFSLIFRKTNKDPTKAWKAQMQSLLRRPIGGNNFIFPAIASTGQLKFGESTSRSAFETLLEEVVEKSDVMKDRNGKFTTHCFRRGGGQYRFLWADRKWSLKAVKWWGGWSSNENVGTLMRYLLDELMAYEEGFSDIMMDDRVIDRHETFMGEDETAPLSKADLRKFEEGIFAKIQGLIGSSASPASGSRITYASPESVASSPPLPPRAGPSRIPETKTLDDALEYWEYGSPQKGLNVPLKNWSSLFKSAEYASEAVKHGNVWFVCEEFQVRFGGDHASFEAKFPGLRGKFTMLMKAVWAERKLRGETKSRSRRKQ
ncbi:hypothetical protein B0H17DRAFT_1146313 [Mycena rosella]|uniref:Tyr recombinase domain-containing protein n=1 Tax=Mycena rosella TaxID=1033263 RepID=A0AAD7CP70_MYCRO|nr:hypothetical protein B0H17DRAFT_1146313 [Mycena rosella]